MTLAELMTANPICATEEETASACLELMRRHGVRHLPVVDATGRLLGLVEEGPLSRAPPGLPVERLCQPVPTANPDESALAVLERLFGHSAAVVVEDGRPVGIVTEHDAVAWSWVSLGPSLQVGQIGRFQAWAIGDGARVEAARAKMHTLGVRHLAVTRHGFLEGVTTASDLRDAPADALVSAHCSSPVVTVSPETTLVEAARRMTEHRIGCLPMVDEHGQPTGIVTRSDVIRALLLGLRKEAPETTKAAQRNMKTGTSTARKAP